MREGEEEGMGREVGREAIDRQWRVGWKGEKGGRNVKRREGESEKEERRGEIKRGMRGRVKGYVPFNPSHVHSNFHW